MISDEGETVKFSKKVIPAESRGLVEKWLLQVGYNARDHDHLIEIDLLANWALCTRSRGGL